MRVVAVAFMICALAFVAGVAGDLSLAAQPRPSDSGEWVRVRLPPNTVRAAPLPVHRISATRRHHRHRHQAWDEPQKAESTKT